MAKFRKKPVVIEAVQFTEAMALDSCLNNTPLPDGVHFSAARFHAADRKLYSFRAFVITAHLQRCFIEFGDWIIPEPDGKHYYPVKPNIFAETYEAVE